VHLCGETVALDELGELPDDVCAALRGDCWNIMLRGAVRLTPMTTRAHSAAPRCALASSSSAIDVNSSIRSAAALATQPGKPEHC
jgi:hypothetical protein